MQCTPVGVTFYSENVEKLKEGETLMLKHEPGFFGKKEYPNAIAIYSKNGRVGSLAESTLPDSPQQSVLPHLRKGAEITAKIVEVITPKKGDSFKKTFSINIKMPNVKYMQSFNEKVEVLFNKDEHTYLYDDKKLLSGSKYASQGEAPFNPDFIAPKCANAWKVPAGEIKAMWESNGNVAAGFGTAIHEALEHYSRFRRLGKDIIAGRNNPENKAMPKHPYLKKIIEDFNELIGDNEVVPEVFVTLVKEGICGQVDRLEIIDEKKKICRIGDYKVNVSGEEKLDKYQKQMSFYAHALIQTGWTVEGLDVYVLENEWKHYKLDVINITL